MDGFLDVSKALWKGLYSRRDCIRQQATTHKFSRRASSVTKDEGCPIYAVTRDVAFSTIGEGIYRRPFI